MATLVGKINNTVLDFVRGVPFQTLNKFEVNLSLGNEYLSSVANANGGGAIANLAQAIVDLQKDTDPSFNKILRVGNSVILQLYAQSITVSLPEIETGSLVNGVKYIKDIKIPEDFEITFLEDELGLTLRIIEYWREMLVGYDNYVMYSDTATSKASVNGKERKINKGEDNFMNKLNNEKTSDTIQNFSGSTINFFNDEYRTTFGSSQNNSNNSSFGFSNSSSASSKLKGIEAYKANMTLKPLSLQDETFVFPSFQMKGVFPKSIDPITFSHDSEEVMMHKVKFSVDAVYTRAI